MSGTRLFFMTISFTGEISPDYLQHFHKSLRVGTLASIMTDVAKHFKLNRDEIADRLFK